MLKYLRIDNVVKTYNYPLTTLRSLVNDCNPKEHENKDLNKDVIKSLQAVQKYS